MFFCIWMFLLFQECGFLVANWPQLYLGIPSVNISLSRCEIKSLLVKQSLLQYCILALYSCRGNAAKERLKTTLFPLSIATSCSLVCSVDVVPSSGSHRSPIDLTGQIFTIHEAKNGILTKNTFGWWLHIFNYRRWNLGGGGGTRGTCHLLDKDLPFSAPLQTVWIHIRCNLLFESWWLLCV